jgi:hypothetical protein
VIRDYPVQDRIAPIPEEYQWESGVPEYETSPEYEEERDWDCALCLYGESSHRQLPCRSCGQEVHVYASDLDEYPFVNWYCPCCLSPQTAYLNSSLSRRRTRARRTTRRSIAAFTPTTLSLQQPAISPSGEELQPSPEPQESNLSPEELEAWEMFEQARSLEDATYSSGQYANSQTASSQTASIQPINNSQMVNHSRAEIGELRPNSPGRKLKRPCRRANPENVSNEPPASGGSREGTPTFVQSLLCNIRSGSGPSRQRNNTSWDKKQLVQTTVRDLLRPMYRSGRIDKDQYTCINKRVSRALYEVVGNDEQPEWKTLVEDYVQKELAKAAAREP